MERRQFPNPPSHSIPFQMGDINHVPIKEKTTEDVPESLSTDNLGQQLKPWALESVKPRSKTLLCHLPVVFVTLGKCPKLQLPRLSDEHNNNVSATWKDYFKN